MEKLYTEEQVREMLKEQREICGEAYYKKSDLDFQANIHDAIDEAPHPNFPAPIKAIPVEKVRDTIGWYEWNIQKCSNDIIETNSMDHKAIIKNKIERHRHVIKILNYILSDGK